MAGREGDVDGRIALVRRVFRAFSQRDLAALQELLSDDCRFWGPTAEQAGRGEPYRGHDGIAAYLDDVAAVWEELRLTPTGFEVAGDAIAVTGRVYAWGGGRVMDAPASWAFRLRGDRVVSVRAFPTTDGGPRAVGLQCAGEDSNLHGP